MKVKNQSRKPSRLEVAAKTRLPKDYPWKVLGCLAKDLSQYLQIQDSQRLESIIRSRDFSAYMALGEEWGLQCMTPSVVSTAELRARYLLTALLKKFQFQSDAKLRQEAAMKKFITAEIICRSYNRSGYRQITDAEDPYLKTAFSYARLWIQKVIGYDLPDFSVLTDKSRHGPGAATGTVKGHTSVYFKYSDWPYHCTAPALGKAIACIKNDERWLGALEDSYRERFNIPKHVILNQETFWSSVIKLVPGNKIAFVPKSSLIDRTIAIEPTLNLYLQLGVDGFIRSRLKRWSINLDCQMKNRELARQGSLSDDENSPVTIDLSMASDTISKRLCRELLPPEWYDYLMDLRSPVGDLNGISFPYEKISSMGNGYTFALESLLFGALIYGAAKARLGVFDFSASAVFGDDLIVPKSLAEDVVNILKRAGFAINSDKSFFKGPVRESCGADWFMGKPMRPVSLTAIPSDVKELFNDYNRIKRHLSLRFGLADELSVLQLIHSYIPSKFKNFFGPCSDEEFDTYIHDESFRHGKYSHSSWHFKRLVRRPTDIKGKRVGLFHFRKLMSSLRPSRVSLNPWDKKRIGGSAFKVMSPNGSHLAYTFSAAHHWQSSYAELPTVQSPRSHILAVIVSTTGCEDRGASL